MQVTEHIHALRIPFKIPISPDKVIDRYVYSYIVFGDKITLVDSGVRGSEAIIFDYIRQNKREPKEISMVILTHSHPDHIGSVRAIREAVGCEVAAHAGEKEWIEDTGKQFNDRPVPGFHNLVDGPVTVDRVLADGEILFLGEQIKCEVMHTPGHSRGSISLLFEGEKAVIAGDSLPLPNDLPTYEDIVASVNSIKRLKQIRNIEFLLSSWEAPIHGHDQIMGRIDEGVSYLRRIHEAVIRAKEQDNGDMMDLCRYVIREIGLPPFAANQISARAFASNLKNMKEFFV